MSIIILSHKVKDYASWKPHYDGDKPRRDEIGLTELCVGIKSDDPSMVYIIWETNDLSGFDKMLNDPSLANKMEEAGVISKPEVVIIN